MTKLERATNRQIIYIIILQFVLALIGAIYGATWMTEHQTKCSYLDFQMNDPWNSNWWLLLMKTLGTWLLIFTYVSLNIPY